MAAVVACSGDRATVIHHTDQGSGAETMLRRHLAFYRASLYLAILAGVCGLAVVSSGRHDPWLIVMAVAFLALSLQFWLRWRAASRQRDAEAPAHAPPR
jgi:putative Ca2+/H+ antiporter (TMEM165/GDT1 family)